MAVLSRVPDVARAAQSLVRQAQKEKVLVAEFLYTVRPSRIEMLTAGPTQDEASALEGHAKYIAGLAANGVVELAGRTQTTDAATFGIVIFRAVDGEAARRIMEADPAVAQGVMEAELFPYRVAFRGKDGPAVEPGSVTSPGEPV
jgi:uncharacterized protein